MNQEGNTRGVQDGDDTHLKKVVSLCVRKISPSFFKFALYSCSPPPMPLDFLHNQNFLHDTSLRGRHSF